MTTSFITVNRLRNYLWEHHEVTIHRDAFDNVDNFIHTSLCKLLNPLFQELDIEIVARTKAYKQNLRIFHESKNENANSPTLELPELYRRLAPICEVLPSIIPDQMIENRYIEDCKNRRPRSSNRPRKYQCILRITCSRMAHFLVKFMQNHQNVLLPQTKAERNTMYKQLSYVVLFKLTVLLAESVRIMKIRSGKMLTPDILKLAVADRASSLLPPGTPIVWDVSKRRTSRERKYAETDRDEDKCPENVRRPTYVQNNIENEDISVDPRPTRRPQEQASTRSRMHTPQQQVRSAPESV